jgi:hypothetical protein
VVCPAISSITGAIALQGMHQVAQKSTITTPFEVSSTKFEVVSVTIFLSDEPDLHAVMESTTEAKSTEIIKAFFILKSLKNLKL